MKSKFFLCLAFYAIFLIGCCSEQAEKEVIKERSTLQDIVDNTNAGEEIDLSQYDNITNYNAVVSKQLTIKNGTLSNAKLIIEADDVKLSGLKDVNVETSKLLGKGKLTITDSKLNDLLLSGGGSDSVYILGMSTVINLTMNYPDVRALLGDGVTVDSLKMQQDAIIQSETDGTAIITDLELIGISTFANIGGGSPEKRAGGYLDIVKINFIGENTQINLNGDISAGKIIAGATSRIITNEHKLDNTDISVSSDSPNSTTLTVVNSAEMIPENLMAIGIKPSYIAGETLNKSDIVLMEELRITGDAVMYKKGENVTESVEKIWIKKSDFDIEIIGCETLTFPAEVGGYTIRITCDDLIFEETINLVSTDENLGNITVALTQEEPRISLYVNKGDGYGYNLYSDDIEKPSGNNFVPTLLAVVDLPEGYTVRSWYLNGGGVGEGETNVLIMLPLENYGNMLRMGMNTISVVVENENEGKFLSDKFDFNYEAAATAE